MKKPKILLAVILLVLFFTQALPVLAHPADVYTHHIHINIAQESVAIKWEIRPGPLLIQSIWFNADADQDGAVNEEEAITWGNARLSQITSLLNGVKLPLTLDGVQFPSSVDLFQAGQEFIVVNLSANTIDSGEIYQLAFKNGFEEQKSLNWYYVTAEDGMKFETPQQKNAQIALKVFPPSAQDGAQVKLLDVWDSSMPSLSSWQGGTLPATPEPAAPTPQQNANLEQLLDLVRAKEFSLSFYIFALGISLVLGALHALTPGHGKTVVAAYLVGSRGTVWHAVVLGSVVTLTHTGSVFLLGIITLAASKYIVPTDIIPWLEILSGLLIVGLGMYLLWQRFVYWWKLRQPAVVQEKSTRKISLTPSAAPKKVTGISVIQKPSANMHHHGDGKLHSHDVPEAITWRSLIALGVSGGLVPCPDAIAILLVAVAINRIFLGLALIVSFSLGLAVVLIAIGLLMVSSRRLFDKVSFLDKIAPVMPIVSAVVVLALGFALTWGAYVRAKDSLGLGEAGAGGVEDARIVYQLEGQDRIKQLFISDIRGSQPVALTSGSNSAVDFAPSPDGSRVVYIAQTGDLKNEIWLADVNSGENKKLADCSEAMCSQPVWSPDGSRVLYEHISLEATNATGLATLWWVDVNTGKAQSLFQEEQLPGANPRWSPDGKWLSYATSENIQLYNLENGESRAITSALGASAAWAPDGKSVLYRDVIIQSNQFITQLFIYDLQTKTSTNISPDLGFENILAAWSPDGEWIAVVRRDLSIPRGDQIWLMRADGSESHAITDSLNSLHGTLSWSGDGKSILYDLYDLDAFPLASKLQMVDVASSKVTDLGIAGYNPKWLWP
ncbi:DPP IV N-terminal domain-containing protein [Candidatus Villigracilis affinis]|uniref:HoxN/HupN/NixA family nickel/cobalt transporter n=1 Tax=Candidatus Villigracilis affinis TaxID=3140682 RepID=UPI001D7F304F|nr:DPP IV N-terminal domain-containing protein [Anaerolineales bacterium]